MEMEPMLLSIVVPAYNESEGIEVFHKELLLPEAKKATGGSYEIIYVNDGSRDDTLDKLLSFAKKDKKVKVLNLSRNFGKEMATTAGILNATGEAILIMDADGQHPPKHIGDFLEKWKSGAQVVVGVRQSNTKEGFVKKWGSKLFYALFNSASGAKMVPRSTDFRLIDRDVQTEFALCTERNRITRGLIDWLGFQRDYIEFSSPARLAGNASYSTRQLIKLAMNSFVSLSIKPLESLIWIGLATTLFSFVLGFFIIIEQLILGDPLGLNITGSAMLGVFITFLVGFLMTAQGVLAIYVSHIYAQSQGRPLYIINRRGSLNLNDEEYV